MSKMVISKSSSIRFLIILAIAPIVALSQSQSRSDAVKADKDRLIERLNLFVKYQVTQQWAKQYDLLSSLNRRAEGKSDFVNRTRQAYSRWGRKPLLRFTPFLTGLVQPDSTEKVVIFGCSELQDKDKTTIEISFVEAYKERNDWFFSEFIGQPPKPGQNPCRETPATPRVVAGLGIQAR